MRRLVGTLCAALIAVCGAAHASSDDEKMAVGAIVTVDGAPGELFAAGAEVTIRGDIGGDLAAFGATVTVESDIGGDVVAAGAKVDFSGAVAGDGAFFGADISISGLVAGDAAAGGSDVNIESGARIAGDAAFGGASVRIEQGVDIGGELAAGGADVKMLGHVGDDVVIGAARAVIDGVIEGDADVTAEEVIIGPLARIEGTLTVAGPKEPTIDPNAIILGDVNYEVLTEADVRKRIKEMEDEFDGDFDIDLPNASPILRGVFAVATLLTGVALGLLFPAWFGGAASAAKAQPLITLGLGLLFVLFMPIAVIVSAITIIGFPFAMVLLALYFVLLATAGVGAGYGLGALIAGRFFEAEASPWLFVIGFVIVCGVGFIPVAGWALATLGWVFGMGVTARGAMAALRGAGEA